MVKKIVLILISLGVVACASISYTGLSPASSEETIGGAASSPTP